jgi:DNA processing protein
VDPIMLTDEDWLLLALAPGTGPVTWGLVMRGEVEPSQLAARLRVLRTGARVAEVERIRRACHRAGIRILTPASPGWPERLRALEDPPAVLYLRGDVELLSRPQIAVVGARRASRRGLADVAWLVPELVAAGLVVTSGLALGIDGAAHRAALAAGGGTLAVLGSGLDRIHPARHRSLAATIAREGLIASEFPLGVPPLPQHFPRRNRIISGLALGVVVIEAGARSGSMITARLAGAQGREVFALPGTARDPNAAGCHRLIREGAVLVRNGDDVLSELGLPPAHDSAVGGEPSGTGTSGTGTSATGTSATGTSATGTSGTSRNAPEPGRILAAIDPGGTVADLVALRTGLDARTLGIHLTELELEGRIARQGDRLIRIDR